MDRSLAKELAKVAETEVERRIVELLNAGKSYREISKIIGISKSSVGNIVARLKKRLKNKDSIKDEKRELKESSAKKDKIEDEKSGLEDETEIVEVSARKVVTKLKLDPEIFYKYDLWVAFVNRFGKRKWDGNFEDFLKLAVDTLLEVCNVETFVVAEVKGQKYRIR